MSIVPGVALGEQVNRLRFYFKRTRNTDIGHAFNVIGYHRNRRASTLWSKCVISKHPLELDGNFDKENILEWQSLNSTGSTLWSKCYSKLLVIKDEIQALETYDLSQ